MRNSRKTPVAYPSAHVFLVFTKSNQSMFMPTWLVNFLEAYKRPVDATALDTEKFFRWLSQLGTHGFLVFVGLQYSNHPSGFCLEACNKKGSSFFV